MAAHGGVVYMIWSQTKHGLTLRSDHGNRRISGGIKKEEGRICVSTRVRAAVKLSQPAAAADQSVSVSCGQQQQL